MRIGLVCHSGFGGSAKVAVGLAGQLAVADHRVHLFCRCDAAFVGELPAAVRAHLVDGPSHRQDLLDVDWPAAELEVLATRISEVATTEGLDILHAHYAVPFASVAARVRDLLGEAAPRLVGTLHGTDVSIYGRDPRVRPRLMAALAGLDAVTTVSSSHAQLAAEVFGWSKPPEVIPNFVDLDRWRPHRHASGRDRRRARIAHVSNFRPVKATASVARVFVAVRRRLSASLWLVGDGADMAAVDAVLEAGGVSADVRHYGLRSDVHRILPRADLLLMTSRNESFCLAALEAQACGVPVVAPRVGGIPEVVDDGVTGLLFDPGDEASATRAVLSILEDPERHALMAKRAVERAQRFAGDEVASRYAALYGRVLRSAAPIGSGGRR